MPAFLDRSGRSFDRQNHTARGVDQIVVVAALAQGGWPIWGRIGREGFWTSDLLYPKGTDHEADEG
jgi:hypothetical protein